MWRACMIDEYNERSLKYFKALFADIFNQKRNKMHYLQTEGLAVTSCMTSAQKFALNFWSKYTLFFYKNIFYKNIEAEICEILRIF